MELDNLKLFEPLVGKIFRHYKGNQYKVNQVARHSETLELVVVYQALYGDFEYWVRPLDMFLETLIVEGKQIPRFELIKEDI